MLIKFTDWFNGSIRRAPAADSTSSSSAFAVVSLVGNERQQRYLGLPPRNSRKMLMGYPTTADTFMQGLTPVARTAYTLL